MDTTSQGEIFLKYYIFFILSMAYFECNAQDQKAADSLKVIYKQNKKSGVDKLELLRNLSFNEIHDIKLSLHYANELIRLSKIQKNYTYLHRGYLQKGNACRLLGNLNKALESFFKSKEAAIKANFDAGQGSANMSIADVYSDIGNPSNARLYYEQAITILRRTHDSLSLATALLNAGEEYANSKNYPIALAYYNESGILFKKLKYEIGTAYLIGNMGMLYAETGEDAMAMNQIKKAIIILEKNKDYYAISDYLTYMSDIYIKRNNPEKALEYANQSLNLATKYGLKKQISISNEKLSELYQKSKNYEKALQFFKKHIVYKDSLNSIEIVQKIADTRTNYEISQKQIEVDLLNQQKKNQRIMIISSFIFLFLSLLLIIGLYRRYQFIKKTKKIIEKEKNLSNSLLLNILPEETAQELKENGKVVAKRYERTTVLFTDFEGFTNYSEDLAPEKLVKSIDYYFSKFDEIINKYDLEKIKTIGDSYMCAGGIPFETDNHAYQVILAAIDIIDFVEQSNNRFRDDQINFKVRVGVNSGSIVAGIVGTKKFAYDIWGDTVNIASRMESNSETGKINISENTYQLVKEQFSCKYRGEIQVKNKGMMKMYFVEHME